MTIVANYDILCRKIRKGDGFLNNEKVAILVKKAALEFDKLSNPILAGYDLTASQYKIIKYLYSHPNQTARLVDLERYYSLTHPTTIGLLDALEKKGFVTREENPEDRRSRILSLTPKALEQQAELEQLGDTLENRLTQGLTVAERQQLIRLLRKLLDI